MELAISTFEWQEQANRTQLWLVNYPGYYPGVTYTLQINCTPDQRGIVFASLLLMSIYHIPEWRHGLPAGIRPLLSGDQLASQFIRFSNIPAFGYVSLAAFLGIFNIRACFPLNKENTV